MASGMIINLVIAGYMAIMLWAGFLSRRFIRTSDDFFRGGQTLPWWAAGLSVAMGSFSALAFVAFGGLAFQHGFLGLLVGAGGIVGYLLAGLFVAGRVRRAQVSSPVEYLEGRFGPGARQGLAWINLVLSPIQTGLRLFAFSALAHTIVGLDIFTTILATGGIVAAYTLLGGVWAVVMTDVIQFVIVLAGTIPLVIVSIDRVGGIGRLVELGALDPGRAQFSLFWLISWWISSILQSMVSFEGIQRYSAMRDERDARKVGFLAAAILLPVPVLMLTPSLIAYYLYPGITGESAFSTMATRLLPPGLVGLMLGAMFAATMSSLSSQFGVDSNIITRDIFQRVINPQASDRASLIVSRAAMVLMAGLATTVAVVIAITQTGIFSLMEIVQSRVLIVIWTPFLLGLYFRRAGESALFFVLGSGLSASLLLWLLDVSQETTRIAVIFLGVGAMLAADRLFPARGPAAQRIRSFFSQLDSPAIPPSNAGRIDRNLTLLRLISYTIIAFGLIPCLTFLVGHSGSALELQVGIALVAAGLAGVALSRRAKHSDADRPDVTPAPSE
jgi:SSS family solute:Na+ symporter